MAEQGQYHARYTLEVETLLRELEASKKHRAEIQDRYDRLEKLYNDQRRSILAEVVEASEEITEDQEVPESVRENIQAILNRLRGRP